METKSKHPTPLPRIWGPCCERCAGLAHADDVTDGDRVQLTYRGRSFSVMLVCVRVSLLDHGSVRVATETTEDMRGIFKGMFVKELAPAKRQVESVCECVSVRVCVSVCVCVTEKILSGIDPGLCEYVFGTMEVILILVLMILILVLMIPILVLMIPIHRETMYNYVASVFDL
ncbi:hypothetical protein AALO_G00035160 [Alosa alosa]|uniref:Uncharacterized protein n=1 Tax=Alosa alosa TaxID=278164 RepID=A0AAV6H663_9TELE|nr:hypothetical protein AALO_G00035160 [Alosa alosa]